jgi:hypothetical protein
MDIIVFITHLMTSAHLLKSDFLENKLVNSTLLDEKGITTGRMITGAAWGEDIPENIAPPMKTFFEGN